jgi:flagellar biosynthesis chaperone FliJ
VACLEASSKAEVEALQTQLVALQEASTQGSSKATALQQQLEAVQRACLEATAALEALEASSKAEVEAVGATRQGAAVVERQA